MREGIAEKTTKVTFCTTGGNNIASYRYRIDSPSKNLQRYGVTAEVSRKVSEDSDVVVFSKHWTENDWCYARFCQLRGQKVIFDICDDHFDHPKHAKHYYRMAEVADAITVNSVYMQEWVKMKTLRDSTVIHDPVLTERKPFKPGPLKLCWYGQQMNIKGLYDVYPEGCRIPLEVVVPARIDPPDHFKLPHVTWSQWHPEAIAGASERNNAALLPYRQERNAKSANRVLEALWSGMYVFTDLIPSVQALGSDGIWDLSKGFDEGVEYFNSVMVGDQIQHQQDKIEREYSPRMVAASWAAVIKVLQGGKA